METIKRLIITIGCLLVFGVGLASYGYYYKMDKVEVQKVDKPAVKPKVENKEDNTALAEEKTTPAQSTEFIEYSSMNERELELQMHGMTHQKVEADQKWINVQMTPERVEAMYAVVKDKEFEDPLLKELMMRILNKWIKGNFSEIVTDHNALWVYEDGNVGEASREFTPEEEKEFVDSHY